MLRVLFVWPGAHGIVAQGRWPFVVIALLYGLVLCALSLVNFYWTELLSNSMQKISMVMLVAVWGILTFQSSSYYKKCASQNRAPAPEKDAFPDAQHHYLQGNWFEAECCLSMLLKKNPRDIEAILMLATLYRHNQRFREAAHLLRSLDLLETAALWKHEIRIEKRMLMLASSQTGQNQHATSTKKQRSEGHQKIDEKEQFPASHNETQEEIRTIPFPGSGNKQKMAA